MKRTIHELLIVLRDNSRVEKSWFGLKQRIGSGLCREIAYLESYEIISEKECMILEDHLYTNKPDQKIHYGWYWKAKLWKPRLKWLNRHIELTKPK